VAVRTSAPLERLSRLGDLIRDVRLANLHQAAAARQDCLTQLQAVSQVASSTGLNPVATQQAALLYDRWADTRRAALNLVLAQRTAEWMVAKEDARLALIRADVLRALKDKR